ncbi:major facilitator superfamily domain-containing protein [Aspergillus granulosus]|uniref:Major facilitator superfamily domain-containing protein n=1 Tax=Aspergillus granulosus TaxID=176169 RepID=A0ABR4HM42_9EURO
MAHPLGAISIVSEPVPPPATPAKQQVHNDVVQTSPPEMALSSTPPPTSRLVESRIAPTTSLQKLRLLSTCMMGFGNGLNDSVPGALIPYMENHYSISYAIVSLIFVTNAIGFIAAAPLTDLVEQRLGRGRAYILAEALMGAGYVIIICTPPYPLVVVAFLLIGLGEGMDLAFNNVFCANYGNGTTALGFLHGSYGLGGTAGPLIGTAIASSGAIWSRFYAVAIVIVAINASFAGWVFWAYETPQSRPQVLENFSLETGSPTTAAAAPAQPSKRGLLKTALKSPVTILGAFFIFAYQGAEVSISGWVISFIVNTRHGDLSSVGYVTAGFWGGIAVGRLLVSPIAFRIGERISVAFFVLGSLAFQLVVWFVPSIVGNAVAVAIIGLLLGPVYPCAMAVFCRVLDANLQLTSLGFVSGAGSSGGAVAPLVTGLVAQKRGTWVLHPICVGLYGGMMGAWCLLPQGKKRDE